VSHSAFVFICEINFIAKAIPESLDYQVEDSISYDEVDAISITSSTKIELVRTNFAEVWMWTTSDNGRWVLDFLLFLFVLQPIVQLSLLPYFYFWVK